MEKINFINGTSPALNATNLNKMQDNIEKSSVIISPTEPTTNEKVWIRQGKNFFNAKNYEGIGVNNGSISVEGNSIRLTSVADDCYTLGMGTGNGYASSMIAIPVNPNTDYTFNCLIDGESNKTNINIAEYDKNYNFIQVLDANSGNNMPLTINTSSNARYVVVRFGVTFSGNSFLFSNIQLEQGTEATEYEEYIEKAIYTKNNNGVFEDIMSNMTAKDWVFDFRRIGDFDINTDGATITYDYSDLGKHDLDTSAVIIPAVRWFRATAVGVLYDNHKANIYITNRQKFGSSSNTGVYALLIYKK